MRAMPLLARLVPRSPRGILFSLFFFLFLGVLGYAFLPAAWYHGYSKGTRTGLLRKFSYKGSPVCRYWSGELALSGTTQLIAAEIWEFTVDGPRSESNPIVQALQKAEAAGRPITLRYRQDKRRWWSCAPSEYYVTGVVDVK